MALMLYGLGHVVHLNQDTSSPDHTRNDNHYKKSTRYFEKFGLNNYLADANRSPARRAVLFPVVPPENRGWLRWRDAGFEKLEDFWDRHKYNGNAAALDADASGTAGEKLGLAEFSNGNFLGEDALYVEYFFGSNGKHYFPYPSLLLSTDFVQRRVQLAPGIFTTFLKDGTAVSRAFLKKEHDGIVVNRHSVLNYLGVKSLAKGFAFPAVSSSINDTSVLFEAHYKLVPKAIEYSAGILDYFFRGKLETTVTWNESLGAYNLAIKNVSGQDLKGGEFRLYWDNESDTRTRLLDPGNDTDGNFKITWSGALADNGTQMSTFKPPTGVTIKKFTLVYKGIIGSNGSGGPVDSVERDGSGNDLAIAAQSFILFNWWPMEEDSDDDRVDVVGGVHMIPIAEPEDIDAVGGKVGKALGFDTEVGAFADNWGDTIAYSGGGLTLVGWVRFYDVVSLKSFTIQMRGYDFDDFRVSIYKEYYSENDWYLSGEEDVAITSPTAGVWHFFVMELDPSGTVTFEWDRGTPRSAPAQTPASGDEVWIDFDG